MLDRFWQTVDVRDPDECWPWRSYRIPTGYGQTSIEGRKQLAHRVAFGLERIPSGLCVLHSCDNPPCCNPAHLFLGTQADNMADMWRKGRARTIDQLTRAERDEVRRELADGKRAHQLAAHYGVHKHVIGRIARGERKTQ